MGSRIVGHAVLIALFLCNRVLVGSSLLIYDVAEFSQRSILCYVDRFLAIFRISRHRSAALCFQCKGKAVNSSPVTKQLGRFKLFLYRCVCIGNLQAFCIIIFDGCAQLVGGIVRLSHSHNDTVRCRIIGYAIHMIVPLCDRVLVDTGLLINDAAEACQRSFLGGCRLIYNVSFVIQRHRRIFRHCCQIEGKAVCLAPVCEILFSFDCRLGGFIGVADRQVVLLLIILDGCCKSVCIRIFGDGHHSNMRGRIIRYAVYSAVLLRDCVGICSCLIIFDLSERCRFITACCFCSHLLRYRNRADRILIICSIYSAYCFQFEIELIGFSPVIKTLGRLQFCLCSGKCVGDRKALFIIICDRCFKSIGLIIHGDADMHTMRCRIIGDTVHMIILLCNRVVIFSGGLIFDLTEDRLHASALCYCNGIARRHGCVFSLGRKLEGEAGCPSPVLNSLSDFKLFLYRSKGVGDCKAVLAIILGKCDQITIVISFYSYYYVVRCCIVGDSCDVVIHFCNRVVISSCLLVFHAAE